MVSWVDSILGLSSSCHDFDPHLTPSLFHIMAGFFLTYLRHKSWSIYLRSYFGTCGSISNANKHNIWKQDFMGVFCCKLQLYILALLIILRTNLQETIWPLLARGFKLVCILNHQNNPYPYTSTFSYVKFKIICLTLVHSPSVDLRHTQT